MAAPYPARLDGRLEEPVNRLLWLVKWALLIPHFLCLAGLWIAMTVLTIVAGFSILFTARYPRGIFDSNVGVIRWTWRVSLYGIGAFGTDRYPPFSLQSDPDYPAGAGRAGARGVRSDATGGWPWHGSTVTS
jgi:hypothetical protein